VSTTGEAWLDDPLADLPECLPGAGMEEVVTIWEDFSVNTDHDGSMDIEHMPCGATIYLHGDDHCPTIARAMEIAREHLKDCRLYLIDAEVIES
jgi:hypothetical protein